jgi:hypothetical protein
MKLHGRNPVLWIAVLIWAGSAAVGLAAEEEERRPMYLYIIEEDIIPEHMETYMQARLADAKLSAQYDFEFPFLTFVQDFHVTTVGIFRSFAQLDSLPQKMEAWNEKTGGKAEKLNKQIMPCISRTSTSINVNRPDLSYFPKGPVFWPDFTESCYQSVTIYHIKPGNREEAEEAGKKIKELNAKKQSPYPYVVEERILGQDASAFCVIGFTKDKATMAKQEQLAQANPDPEGEKVAADYAHVVTRIETKEATFVPEASYVPKGTFGSGGKND